MAHIILIILLLVSAAVFGAPAESDEAPASAPTIESTYGDWSKVCATSQSESEKACQIVQTASQNESGKRILQTSIGYIQDSDKPILTLTAPLGIYLPKGITISVDDTPITATIRRCDQTGCLAYIAMEKNLVESMKKHESGSVLIATTPQNNLKLPLSLKGFADALASLSPSLDRKPE